jgi:hypothetical protein
MKINWLGILASLMLITLLFNQFTHPPTSWWCLTVGSEDGYLVKADVSPFLIDVTIWGLQIDSPILRYGTLSISLMILATAITMMLGSIFLKKPWAKYLIDFAYLKPALTLIFFIGLLFAISGFTGSSFQSEIPLTGDVEINFHYEDANIQLQTLLPVHTTFSWPFIFAITTAALSIATKIYHDKLCKDIQAQEESHQSHEDAQLSM